jgi:hypothetical protein
MVKGQKSPRKRSSEGGTNRNEVSGQQLEEGEDEGSQFVRLIVVLCDGACGERGVKIESPNRWNGGGRKGGRRKHTEKAENRRGEKEGSDDEEIVREESSGRRIETGHEVLQGGYADRKGQYWYEEEERGK